MDLTEHRFTIDLTWTGNTGDGTSGYRSYSRDHTLSAADVPQILGSAAKTFHGDRSRWNPELLLLAAVAECHMLTYLHLATKAGIVVTGYRDSPVGTLRMDPDGLGGEFSAITLRPVVTVSPGDDPEQTRSTASQLHHEVGKYCFIARSISAPIHHEIDTLLSADR